MAADKPSVLPGQYSSDLNTLLSSFIISGLMKKGNGEYFLDNLTINTDISIEYKVPFVGTLLNVMYQPRWRRVWGRMDTSICVAESLRCLPKTITTLLISHTPIQNVFGVKKIKYNFVFRGRVTSSLTCG